MLLFLVLLAGCAVERSPGAAPAPVSPVPAPTASPGVASGPETGAVAVDAWQPTPEVAAMTRALSVRDPEPACEAIEALSSTPVQSLREVVDHVEMPPWAPMRAAGCLVARHGDATRDDLLAWVADPERQGLARLALSQLDVLPAALALEVATAGLAGPQPDHARERIAASTRPELRALLGDE